MDHASLTLYEKLALSCFKVSVFDYRCELSIGAYANEHRHLQPVIFCVDVWVQRNNNLSDSLAAVYDYTQIIAAIDSLANGAHIELQETLAQRLCSLLLTNPTLAAVRVSVRKPQAYPGADAIGVELFSLQDNPS